MFATLIIVKIFLFVGFVLTVRRYRRSLALPASGNSAPRELRENSAAPSFAGLFPVTDGEIWQTRAAHELRVQQAEILARAQSGDCASLTAAHALRDGEFYDATLRALTETVRQHSSKLGALVVFLLENDGLQASGELVALWRNVWLSAPQKKTLAALLDLASRSHEAEVFRRTVNDVAGAWRAGRVEELTLAELAQTADSFFHLLPQAARSSGAGFLLKQELANLRAEAKSG